MSMLINSYRFGSAPGAFSPLDIAWHASFWAEGPEFVTLGLANGAAVATWPDESNSRDATQATGANQPIYRSSTAAFNNKPTIDFTGFDRLATAAWTAISQPSTVFAVGAFTNWTEGGFRVMFDGLDVNNRHGLLVNTTTNPDTWWVYGGSGTISGGSLNTSAHAFVCEYNTTTSALIVDGTTTASGSAGSHNLTGLRIGIDYAQTNIFNGHLSFIGVINRLLTTQEKSDLHSWAQTQYGVS